MFHDFKTANAFLQRVRSLLVEKNPVCSSMTVSSAPPRDARTGLPAACASRGAIPKSSIPGNRKGVGWHYPTLFAPPRCNPLTAASKWSKRPEREDSAAGALEVQRLLH